MDRGRTAPLGRKHTRFAKKELKEKTQEHTEGKKVAMIRRGFGVGI